MAATKAFQNRSIASQENVIEDSTPQIEDGIPDISQRSFQTSRELIADIMAASAKEEDAQNRCESHKDRYIQNDSHHHPAQKTRVINTLAIRAKQISDTAHLDQELDHHVKVFKSNGYNEHRIRKTIKKS